MLPYGRCKQVPYNNQHIAMRLASEKLYSRQFRLIYPIFTITDNPAW